jgi:predicted kinase
MATLHLISGLPCSGKTTYATSLRTDLGGVAFSLDKWLITLFGQYSIAQVGHEEHVRRVLANRELIWDAASEFLKRGVDVILDDGFFFRANRMQVIDEARQVGAGAKIHFIDTPLTVIRSRLEARNARLPRYNFWIGPDTLQAFAGLFESPTGDEGAEVVVVRDFAILQPPSTDG